MAKATMAATAMAGVVNGAAVANDGVSAKRMCFRVAGYLFTYRKSTGATKVRIDMWREDPSTRERYWITVAACAPNRASARSVALALTAWVKSCDIGPKRDVQSQAGAESFAMLRQHLAFTNPGASGSVRGRRVAAPGVSPVEAAAVTQGKHAANDSNGITRRGAIGGTRVVAA
jgi:hypothetical protein